MTSHAYTLFPKCCTSFLMCSRILSVTSAWFAVDRGYLFGAGTLGDWTAWPDVGSPDADPYSKARVARAGVLALGRAEGLSFVADHDTAGDPLRRECAYSIEGSFPTARLWTLYAADQSLDVIATGMARPAALHAQEILRQPDNSAIISVGRQPYPGNWLPVRGDGPLHFVLTFYDTPIASSTGLSDVTLPLVRKAGCHA